MNKSLSGFILYRNGNGKLSKVELIEKNLNRVIRNQHLLSRYTWRTDHYGSISAWLHNFCRHKKLVQRNLKLNWMKDCIIKFIFSFNYDNTQKKSVIDRMLDYIVVEMVEMIQCSIYIIYFHLYIDILEFGDGDEIVNSTNGDTYIEFQECETDDIVLL